MSTLAKLLLGSTVLVWWTSGAQKTENGPETLLFPPGAFVHAPVQVRQKLEEMRCRIFKKNNLIEGKFATEQQDDWAALCVIDDKIQPVVLWGGKTQCDPRPSPARDYKELLADPLRDAYIAAADAKKIVILRRIFGGMEKLPPITHAGLEVGDEQASVIYICQQGKWIELIGDD